jgi:hypothetical protein
MPSVALHATTFSQDCKSYGAQLRACFQPVHQSASDLPSHVQLPFGLTLGAFNNQTRTFSIDLGSPFVTDYKISRLVTWLHGQPVLLHWWFSGKIGRCHVKYIFLDIGQPRVRFPADAFLPVSPLWRAVLLVLLMGRGIEMRCVDDECLGNSCELLVRWRPRRRDKTFGHRMMAPRLFVTHAAHIPGSPRIHSWPGRISICLLSGPSVQSLSGLDRTGSRWMQLDESGGHYGVDSNLLISKSYKIAAISLAPCRKLLAMMWCEHSFTGLFETLLTSSLESY